jgi:hypothetical protein
MPNDYGEDQQETIEKILRNMRRLAVVGFSSRPEKPAHYVPAYLQEQGYEIIPVNPHLESGLGKPAYPDLAAIPGKVDLVLLFLRSEDVPPFVEQAIEIGAKAVWMQLGIAHQGAAARARQAGLEVVIDACIMTEHRRRRAISW